MTEQIAFAPAAAAPNTRILAGSFIIGAAGAITAQTGQQFSGFTVSKTAATNGRYTLTLHRNYGALLSRHVDVTGPDTAALPTTTGLGAVFRDQDIGGSPRDAIAAAQGAGNAHDGTMEVQLYRTDTNADADAASGTIVGITLVVADI